MIFKLNLLKLLILIIIINHITTSKFNYADSTFVNKDHLINDNNNDFIHIVYAIDKHTFALSIVSVASIIKSAMNPNRLFFHFVLIDMQWDKQFLDELTLLFHNNNNNTYVTNFEAVSWDPLPNVIKTMHVRGKRQDLASPANYARFYISSIFTNTKIDRLIYLDNDIIAINPIEELWEIDLKDNILGMVEDCQDGDVSKFYRHVIEGVNYNLKHPIVRKVFNNRFDYGCYPNAGVMLINQVLFNQNNILQQIENLITLNQREYVFKLGSQPLIVLTTWNKFLPFNEKFNYRNTSLLTTNQSNSIVLLHYSGGGINSKGFMNIIFCTLIQTEYKLQQQQQQFVNVFCNAINTSLNTTNNVHYLNEKQLLWCKLATETYLKLNNCNNCTKIKELFQLSVHSMTSHTTTKMPLRDIHTNTIIHNKHNSLSHYSNKKNENNLLKYYNSLTLL